jgi:hypothetical protein
MKNFCRSDERDFGQRGRNDCGRHGSQKIKQKTKKKILRYLSVP